MSERQLKALLRVELHRPTCCILKRRREKGERKLLTYGRSLYFHYYQSKKTMAGISAVSPFRNLVLFFRLITHHMETSEEILCAQLESSDPFQDNIPFKRGMRLWNPSAHPSFQRTWSSQKYISRACLLSFIYLFIFYII